MSIEKAREHLSKFGVENRIVELPVSSATVELAAKALGRSPERIAKTISFYGSDGGVILIVAAGDAKIDNKRFKERFGLKAKMLAPEDAERLIGHAVGGICPFGVNEGVRVFLDVSLKRCETVFPACGSSNSEIELTCEELEEYAVPEGWVDVCKGWAGDARGESHP